MDAEAEYWKARYKCVVGLVGPEHVEAAEKLVKAAITLGTTTNKSTKECLDLMFFASDKIKKRTEPSLEFSIKQAKELSKSVGLLNRAPIRRRNG